MSGCVVFHAVSSSSFEWIEKKNDPEDSEMGLAELWTCGFEQWSYSETQTYTVLPYLQSKK